MKPEELDKATADEAWRIMEEGEDVAVIAARLAREGWTPPPTVDPDVLAFREWGSKVENAAYRETVLAGEWDHCFAAKGFVAGARMARERAQVVSDALVEALDDYGNWDYWDKELRQIIDNYKAGKEATQ
jgi:hypothetical protein